jgi:hypothetical protein
MLAEAAAVIDGEVFGEGDIGGAVEQARAGLGQGETQPRDQRDLLALMPYVMLSAFLPLAAVLRHRNL